jgi:hypothetical protein
MINELDISLMIETDWKALHYPTLRCRVVSTAPLE